mmetsp:Transcript_40306/g.110989  ORF Transcript_40306/g.110989 Transcript_40306/m.110989 type:complete len:466 (+) Transcript_40306:694-2091(+)
MPLHTRLPAFQLGRDTDDKQHLSALQRLRNMGKLLVPKLMLVKLVGVRLERKRLKVQGLPLVDQIPRALQFLIRLPLRLLLLVNPRRFQVTRPGSFLGGRLRRGCSGSLRRGPLFCVQARFRLLLLNQRPLRCNFLDGGTTHRRPNHEGVPQLSYPKRLCIYDLDRLRLLAADSDPITSTEAFHGVREKLLIVDQGASNQEHLHVLSASPLVNRDREQSTSAACVLPRRDDATDDEECDEGAQQRKEHDYTNDARFSFLLLGVLGIWRLFLRIWRLLLLIWRLLLRIRRGYLLSRRRQHGCGERLVLLAFAPHVAWAVDAEGFVSWANNALVRDLAFKPATRKISDLLAIVTHALYLGPNFFRTADGRKHFDAIHRLREPIEPVWLHPHFHPAIALVDAAHVLPPEGGVCRCFTKANLVIQGLVQAIGHTYPVQVEPQVPDSSSIDQIHGVVPRELGGVTLERSR